MRSKTEVQRILTKKKKELDQLMISRIRSPRRVSRLLASIEALEWVLMK